MKQGFTLIELLIVIVLLGLVVALVGPLTIQQVDNARARNEQQLLMRWLRQQSFDAFAQQQQKAFVFDGKAIYSHAELQQASEPLRLFNYLFFVPQSININQNGHIVPDRLQLSTNGRPQHIELAPIFAGNVDAD